MLLLSALVKLGWQKATIIFLCYTFLLQFTKPFWVFLPKGVTNAPHTMPCCAPLKAKPLLGINPLIEAPCRSPRSEPMQLSLYYLSWACLPQVLCDRVPYISSTVPQDFKPQQTHGSRSVWSRASPISSRCLWRRATPKTPPMRLSQPTFWPHRMALFRNVQDSLTVSCLMSFRTG